MTNENFDELRVKLYWYSRQRTSRRHFSHLNLYRLDSRNLLPLPVAGPAASTTPGTNVAMANTMVMDFIDAS